MFNCKVDATFKARLVVHGWGLMPGMDCGGTFAPVCRRQSIHIVLAIASRMNFEGFQLDVQTAFMFSDVEDDVYAKTTRGCEKTKKTESCK